MSGTLAERKDEYTPSCLQALGAHYDPRFAFDPAEHKYTFEGREMTGTTTVLKGIKNPDALLGWAANCAVDHILAGGDPEEARTAHTRVRDKRRDEGIGSHALVEKWIGETFAFGGDPVPTPPEEILPFATWAVENNVRFLGSEVPVYSQQEFVGGIIDFLLEKDGKVYVGDLKTNKRPRYGSGIYYSYWMQLASYRNCIESLGGEVGGQLIVRMNGNDIEVMVRDRFDEDRRAFLGALEIYRATSEYERSLGLQIKNK